jgi:hypothetical protein
MKNPTTLLAGILLPACAVAETRVGRYELFEATFEAAAAPANAYVELSAEATFTRPDGRSWAIPLFWDGGRTWKVRVSPDVTGRWSYTVKSSDPGLSGRSGAFECVASDRPGGLRPMPSAPSHFQRQNGAPVWFLGDTAWGYFTDSPEDNHHRLQTEHYVQTRAAQGFNVIHCMLMSEQGVGNQNGKPFDDLSSEKLNPRYWQEVDQRLAFANRHGLTVGLALAWGDKRKVEPFAWRRFPNLEARRRYARYIASRYSAYDVYFLISGEWHAEARTREKATEEQIFHEFVEIGNAVAAADPHDRMAAIHPMTEYGSVREFASAPWMSFGDYQQNYRNLHGRILVSRYLWGPVVNSEYGYLFRDADGDGKPDKSNSYSTEDMRFASWDIVTAGGYLVNGFGTTYFAGHRDPGPFDVDAAKNDEWERQIGYIRKFFEQTEWWKLVPADELVSSPAARGSERPAERGIRPPATTYWAMANPGETYLLYVRGTTQPLDFSLGARPRHFRIREFNPRTGQFRDLGEQEVRGSYRCQPPDEQDWIILLSA